MSKKLITIETDINILHQVSEEVDLNNLEQVNMIESALIGTFNKLDGCIQGIAGVQVGQLYRAMLLRYVKGKEPIIVFNPEVKFKIGFKKSYEMCQSELGAQYLVRRPILVKVSYWTKYREKVTEWLPYRKARIFMHEYDHLNGVLLQDKGIVVG